MGLAVATVCGLAANRATEPLVASKEKIGGFPRWRWVLSVITQGFVFPALIALCVFSRFSSISLADWLAAPASKLQGFEWWYVYALFASMSRDMFPMPAESSMLMKVHHWLVVFACVFVLLAPKGFGLFVAGTFILECGSMTYNLRELYPNSIAMQWVYQLSMPVSNIVAVAGGLYMLRMPGLPLWMKVLYFTADIGVCLGRQRHAIKDAQASGLLGKPAPLDDTSPQASSAVATKAFRPQQRLRRRQGHQWPRSQGYSALTFTLIAATRRLMSPARFGGSSMSAAPHRPQLARLQGLPRQPQASLAIYAASQLGSF